MIEHGGGGIKTIEPILLRATPTPAHVELLRLRPEKADALSRFGVRGGEVLGRRACDDFFDQAPAPRRRPLRARANRKWIRGHLVVD